VVLLVVVLGCVRRKCRGKQVVEGLLCLRPGEAQASDANEHEAFPVQCAVTVFATAATDVHVRY
jgi:hypothetical protein